MLDMTVQLAISIAKDHSLDPALVCAIIEQESGWNPWAIRYEPEFMAKYVAPLYTNNKISATEAFARSFSWGLMQVMGQVARENGYSGQFLAGLCDPNQGVTLGCKVLTGKLSKASGDIAKGLQLWNGGGNPNYATQVMSRLPHYQ
jgi:soluble lytic murein transglycosylase-like protein